jgi:hypothetical protein
VGNHATGAVDWSGWIVADTYYPLGHHWIPVSVTNQFENSLEPGAKAWAYYFTSGKLNEPHNFGSVYNGVRHADYNKLVEEELRVVVERARRQSRLVTRDEIADLGRKIEQGLGFDGMPRKEIGLFNAGIADSRTRWVQGGPTRGFRVARTDDYLEQGGRRIAGSGRFRGLLVGAGAVGTFGSIFGNTQAFADQMGDENSKLRGAFRRIEKDDFLGAQILLEQFFEEFPLDGAAGYGKELLYKDAIVTALVQLRRRADRLALEFGDDGAHGHFDSPETAELETPPVAGVEPIE